MTLRHPNLQLKIRAQVDACMKYEAEPQSVHLQEEYENITMQEFGRQRQCCGKLQKKIVTRMSIRDDKLIMIIIFLPVVR